MLGGIRNLALLVVISASLVSEGSFQAIQRKERSNDADSLLPLWFAGQRNDIANVRAKRSGERFRMVGPNYQRGYRYAYPAVRFAQPSPLSSLVQPLLLNALIKTLLGGKRPAAAPARRASSTVAPTPPSTVKTPATPPTKAPPPPPTKAPAPPPTKAPAPPPTKAPAPPPTKAQAHAQPPPPKS